VGEAMEQGKGVQEWRKPIKERWPWSFLRKSGS
jgi:hypothetical protein